MMDAETTWRAWRRILREDEVYAAVLSGSDAPGRSPEEREVLRGYAAIPRGVRWGVETYRFRLASSALHALESGAPLTRRVLEVNGVDVRAAAEAWTVEVGRRDDGPYTCRTGVALLDFVVREFGAIHGLADVARLERTALELLIAHADATPDRWTSGDPRRVSEAELEHAWVHPTGTGVAVETSHTLTPWLTDKLTLGKGTLDARAQVFLVYLPGPDKAWRLAGIGELARRAVSAPEQPWKTLATQLTDGSVSSTGALARVVAQLVGWGVLRVSDASGRG